MATIRPETRLQASLADILRLLEKHRVLDALVHHQEGPKRDLLEDLQRRQNLAELNRHVRAMHAADAAYVLEALPLDERRTLWEQVSGDQAGQVFVEVSDAVRASLVEATPRDDLLRMLTALDAEDLAYVSDSLPPDVIHEVSLALAGAERTVFEDTIQYAEDAVGHYMTREWLAVSDTLTVEQAIVDLRNRGDMPPHTDRIFVTDARHVLVGAVPLPALLVRSPTSPVVDAMSAEMVSFGAFDDVRDAVNAFERYDLISAPVVDERGKLVGRLTVDAAMDALREQSTLQALRSAGLREDEDLFATPVSSARNRWPWLGINLVTAFVASRVIGQFEASIQSLAALAALMPIVASIGGNTGNQTVALVIRGLAVDQIQLSGARQLLRKEVVIGLLNGVVWGLLVGVFAVVFYRRPGLGAVMTGAVILNLVVASIAGVAIPMGLHAAGRDPAQGSSVLLTFITDAMGFLLFLGLASLFLF
jgi:magnesium transporter